MFPAQHNILELVLEGRFDYSTNYCSKSLLKKDFIPFLTPSLPNVHFFHFSDTCSLGSNGSTKFLESLLSLIPF
jgi:hypothetical protein